MGPPTRAPDDWRRVVEELAVREDDLSTDDLELLARGHWWLGDVPESSRVEEVAHHRHLADGNVEAAVESALRLCEEWGTRGDLALAMAWLSTARRLLGDLPRGRLHGYLDYLLAFVDLDLEGDIEGAAATSVGLRALAAAEGDANLDCFALALSGFAAVSAGDLAGFTALDEAMIPVVSGRVDPIWGGDVYCSVIHLCESLGDLSRMRAWTDALARWAAPLSSTFMYAGITRLHQLQLLRAEGEWDAVLAELESQSIGLADAHGWLAGTGFYELGEIHRARGDVEAAGVAFGRATSFGIEPQPGAALLQHSAGHTDAALASLRMALAECGPLGRARLLEATVRVAIAAGDLALVDELAAEAEATARRFGTPGLVAGAAHVRALCHLARGEYADARPRLEEAARVYRDQRHRHALARTHEDLASVWRGLGDVRQANAEVATASAIYLRLGAAADLERLRSPSHPGGLTDREVEVLARVSTGLTNKQVAAALVISEKTVSRHLGSIFLKTGVTSRTAAAAWAREHHLV